MRPRKPRKNHTPTEHELRFRKVLGERIKHYREPLYSQEEFADLVDVYRTHVSTMENGKTDMRLSTLLRVAGVLNLPLDEIIRQTYAELPAE